MLRDLLKERWDASNVSKYGRHSVTYVFICSEVPGQERIPKQGLPKPNTNHRHGNPISLLWRCLNGWNNDQTRRGLSEWSVKWASLVTQVQISASAAVEAQASLIPAFPSWEIEQEDEEPVEVCRLANLNQSAEKTKENLSQTRWKVRTDLTPEIVLWPLYTVACMCSHSHSQTHEHTGHTSKHTYKELLCSLQKQM